MSNLATGFERTTRLFSPARRTHEKTIDVRRELFYFLRHPATAIELATMHAMHKTLDTQMQAPELVAIARAIVAPANVLVFGLGNDAPIWAERNKNGRTAFLEDEEAWIEKIRAAYPLFEIHHVSYGTRRPQWREFLDHPEKLGFDVRKEISETRWDVAIVDGPAGYKNDSPGRMKSIFAASTLTRRGGSVFVHDAEREVEREFSRRYLRDENLVEEIRGRAHLRHYRLP